jgi:hypothetical protein
VSGDSTLLLCGSLAVFPAQEVLQWLAHHSGEGVLRFDVPAGEAPFHGSLGVHVHDGVVVSVKPGDTGWVARENAKPRFRTAGQVKPSEPDPLPQSCVPAAALQPKRGTLGAILLEKNLLTIGQLRYGLAMQRMALRRKAPPRLGDLLEKLGFVSRESIEDALKDLAAFRLAELCCCSEGQFTLLEGGQTEPCLPSGERVQYLLLRAVHIADHLGWADSDS